MNSSVNDDTVQWVGTERNRILNYTWRRPTQDFRGSANKFNKPSAVRIEEFSLSQSEDYSLEAWFPHDWETAPEKQGSQHSFISCQNKEHSTSQGYISSRFQITDQPDVHGESAWPWHLGGRLTIKGGPAPASQEGKRLIFILNMDSSSLLVSVCFSLIIKADVRCMFDRPRTGCSS